MQGSNISDLPLREFIEQECRSLLSADPLIALPILVHLLVMHTIPCKFLRASSYLYIAAGVLEFPSELAKTNYSKSSLKDIILHYTNYFQLYLASVEEMVHKPVSLLEQQRKWIDLLYTYTQADAEGSSDNHPATIAQKVSLGWVGHALACMADKKWIEARDAIKKSKIFR